MLVLSRKENESIAFPNLGISIEILRTQGRAVKVGIRAPKEFDILRGELIEGDMQCEIEALEEAARKRRHDVRNGLHRANLALAVLQKQLDKGELQRAQRALSQAIEAFSELDEMAKDPIHARQELQTEKRECRALLVEDDENERELLAGFLELCGYKVDAVSDGVAAMDYLEKQSRPDIVLLDMNMPRMDGPATISAIRKHPEFADIKLFAVSGADESTITASQADKGVDHWFSKPINPSKFAGDLQRHLSTQAL